MILPPGSLLTFTDSVTGFTSSVAVSSIKFKTNYQPFQRMEYSHKRLLEAPNVDGSMPIISYLIGNRPVLYFTGCNSNETGRDLTPDDSDYDNIYKRFDIKRYEIVGAESLSSETDKLFTIGKNHSVLLAEFTAFLQEAKGYVSVNFLRTMQSQSLSYLTSTGLSMAGQALGVSSPENNLLITDYASDVALEEPLNSAGNSSRILRTFTLVLEQRTIVNDRSVVY